MVSYKTKWPTLEKPILIDVSIAIFLDFQLLCIGSKVQNSWLICFNLCRNLVLSLKVRFDCSANQKLCMQLIKERDIVLWDRRFYLNMNQDQIVIYVHCIVLHLNPLVFEWVFICGSFNSLHYLKNNEYIWMIVKSILTRW